MKCLLQIYDGRNEFYQWDYNQKLLVLDDRINQVHFSHVGMEDALIENVYFDEFGKRVCNVPNFILQIGKVLLVYAYLKTEDNGETLYTIKFNVIKREIPSDYLSHSQQQYEKLDERIMKLEEKVGDLSVDEQIKISRDEIIDKAPSDMNTLNKISNSLGNDPGFSQNVYEEINNRVANKDLNIKVNNIINERRSTGDLGVPIGGTYKQVLIKKDESDFHTEWHNLNDLLPNNYIHNQLVPESQWVIKHNLNKFPSVTIVDTGNNVVIGDIIYIDENSLIVNFNYSFGGKAYLN